MFSCRDITQRICRRLEACDVFNLVKVNEKAHEMIMPLLIGAVVGRREIRQNIAFTVTTIPLLGIMESFPANIVRGDDTYTVSRALRIRELEAEIVCMARSTAYISYRYAYVIKGHVQHHICMFENGVCISYELLRPLTLCAYLDVVGTGDVIDRPNPRLMEALRALGVVSTRYAWPTMIIETQRCVNWSILNSEELLQLVAGWVE